MHGSATNHHQTYMSECVIKKENHLDKIDRDPAVQIILIYAGVVRQLCLFELKPNQLDV